MTISAKSFSIMVSEEKTFKFSYKLHNSLSESGHTFLDTIL